MTVGELMRVLRKAAGLTLGAVARAMERGVIHASNLKRGDELPPTQADMRRLAEILETDPRGMLALAAVRIRALLRLLEASGSLGAAIKIRAGDRDGSIRVSLSIERPLESPADVFAEFAPSLQKDDWAEVLAWFERVAGQLAARRARSESTEVPL